MFLKASCAGDEDAPFYYNILKIEIEKEESFLRYSGHDQSDDDQHILEIKQEESTLDVDSSDDSFEEDSCIAENCPEVQQSLKVKDRSYLNIKTETFENVLSEELSILKRKEIKTLKKKQREKKKKDLSNKFKKLLRSQLSEQEKTALMLTFKRNSSKEGVCVSFDKNAQDQWVALNAFERNKVSDFIADIKLGGKRGKPEKLKNSDAFSRRITEKHRLVYQIENNGDVKILSCQGHYDD